MPSAEDGGKLGTGGNAHHLAATDRGPRSVVRVARRWTRLHIVCALVHLPSERNAIWSCGVPERRSC